VFWKQFFSFFDPKTSVGRIGLGLLGIVCAGLIGGAWWWSRSTQDTFVAINPSLVETVVAKVGPISRVYNTNGVLAAVKIVQLFPEIDGRVKQIFFKQGAYVKKGDLLLQMDDRLLQAQLEEAKARLDLAESDFERATTLYNKKFLAKAMYDDKKAKRGIALAEVKIAKARVEQAKIAAPFDGVMSLLNVNEGATIIRNKDVATILVLDPLYVDFSVPESLFGYLSSDSTVDVWLGSQDLPIEGVIEALDSKVNPGTHSIQVRAKIPNEDNKMRPGQFSQVSLNLGQEKNAIVIPIQAVFQEGDSSYVYTVSDNIAIKKEVTLGVREQGQVHVKDGLKNGELVVVVGQINLQDSAPVRIKD